MTNPQCDELARQLSNLEARVSEVQQDLWTTTKEVEGLQSKLDALEHKVDYS